MKLFILLTAFISNFAHSSDLKLSSTIFLGQSVPFLKFEGPGPFDNYLAMNLPFNPVANVFQQLQSQIQRPLINRGEAHITVITPVEYWNVLRPRGISIKEINQIADKFNIQRSRFNIICLGQGKAVLNNKTENTFYIVVNSEDLLNLRKSIQALFVRRGGSVDQFNPGKYFPHITVGFTKVDLHEINGVIKDVRSCVSKISLMR